MSALVRFVLLCCIASIVRALVGQKASQAHTKNQFAKLFAETEGTASGKGNFNAPNAKVSAASKVVNDRTFANEDSKVWPFTVADLTPDMPGNDGLFYLTPRIGVQHAADEAREALTTYYKAAFDYFGKPAVLDLCSSWTSHYPENAEFSRCCVLGLNWFELMANAARTEAPQCIDLNTQGDSVRLPYDDNSFNMVTNALSVDYLTSPRAVFREMYRVLKPGGLATCAFTNRCFPNKVVSAWLKPFDDVSHCKIVAKYFYHADVGFERIEVVDVSPPGWTGRQNPMYVVQAWKAEDP